MRVLVIEDNPKMVAAIEKGLKEGGFSVDATSSGRDGEEKAAEGSYDVIVLDVMLSDHDGLDLCRNLRRRGTTTPILMLTALAGTPDKVAGLDAGADDYLTKPFDFEELTARLRALLRRPASAEGALLKFGDVELDLAGYRATRQGQSVDLSRKELGLLEYFMRNPNRVLTRSAIGEHVWDLNFNPFSNVIDVYVSMLRRKLDKPFDKPLIHTVVGTGYRFGDPAPGTGGSAETEAQP